MPIRAVLLDFEGLLFDSGASCLQAAVEFMRENGKIWTARDHPQHSFRGFTGNLRETPRRRLPWCLL